MRMRALLLDVVIGLLLWGLIIWVVHLLLW